MATRKYAPTDIEICPFRVVVDTREQTPYHFHNLEADSDKKYRPLIVRTKTAALQTGDYSIEGMEHQITIERKSLTDAYGSFGAGRSRFVRELERMSEMEFAALVIEASWGAIINDPPPQSRLRPKTVYRSLIAWMQRYRVHVLTCPTRAFAERTTFRMLERFWKDRQAERGQGNK